MMTISVKALDFSADAKLVAFIEKKLQRLTKYFDREITAEVHLKLQNTGSSIKQKIAEIHLQIPGGWLVDKKSDLTFEAAISASSETLKRQLVKHKEKITRHIS
jgi:putative sigma-54 modulation protein